MGTEKSEDTDKTGLMGKCITVRLKTGAIPVKESAIGTTPAPYEEEGETNWITIIG